jgi:chromate transporter
MELGDMMERIKEIFLVFLKLGLTAFGGPAGHVALMEDELVTKRQWVSRQEFLDMYGLCNIIPGPNSTELAIHLSLKRGGIWGMFVGGFAFILPPFLMILGLGYLYVTYGAIPEVTNVLAGVKPVVIAIILNALIKLWKKAVKVKIAYFLAAFVVLLAFLDVHELLIFLIAGTSMLLILNIHDFRKHYAFAFPLVLLTGSTPLHTIFLNFLKIGSILYGGGYVLLVFIQADFVDRLGLITYDQLLDAIAIGQITPGPLFTTSTFIGFILADVPGAIVATLGIFLPSFIMIALLHNILPALNKNKYLRTFLDGVIVASLGLMIYVLYSISVTSFINIWTVFIFILAFILLFKYKVNTAFLIIGGALIGFLIL